MSITNKTIQLNDEKNRTNKTYMTHSHLNYHIYNWVRMCTYTAHCTQSYVECSLFFCHLLQRRKNKLHMSTAHCEACKMSYHLSSIYLS